MLLVSAKPLTTNEFGAVVVTAADEVLAPPLEAVFVAPIAAEPFVPDISAPEKVIKAALDCGKLEPVRVMANALSCVAVWARYICIIPLPPNEIFAPTCTNVRPVADGTKEVLFEVWVKARITRLVPPVLNETL